MPKQNKLTFEMTRGEAERAGLLTCECGHPPNNHFDKKNACARPYSGCTCKKLKLRSRYGKLINGV